MKPVKTVNYAKFYGNTHLDCYHVPKWIESYTGHINIRVSFTRPSPHLTACAKQLQLYGYLYPETASCMVVQFLRGNSSAVKRYVGCQRTLRSYITHSDTEWTLLITSFDNVKTLFLAVEHVNSPINQMTKNQK